MSGPGVTLRRRPASTKSGRSWVPNIAASYHRAMSAPIEQPVFLSSKPASKRGRRLALGVVVASFAIFLALVPFAKVQLAPVIAFIPVYQSAMVVNDLITAALLFG